MNTFTAKNEKETQSLLSQNEEGEKKKTTSAKKNVFLTVGGLAAVGILGLASSKSSSFGSAAPFTNGSRLGQTQSTIRLSVGCSPQDVLSLLPFEPKSWRGKVGAKFITANMSPNFSYENAIDMPEEMCGVFAVPHELAHDARYGFFLYEKANPENFVSDIGVQPKGGYADIEIVEEEVQTAAKPVSKKEEKKQEKAKEMKQKEGEFEDGTKMTPTQKEFFEKKATLAHKESKSSSSKKASKKSAAAADEDDDKEEEEEETEAKKSSSSSSSSKKETAEEKMVRLQQEKIDILEKEVQEAREADAEKERLATEEEAKHNEEAEREKEQLEREEFLKQEKDELEKAKTLAKEKKNVGAFFDWGWWSSSLFHAEEEIAQQSKEESAKIKSRRALLSSAHKPVQKLAVPHKKTAAKLSVEQQKKVEEYDREVSMIKSAKKQHKDVEISSENPIEVEVVQARIEYPVQFISTMASCNTKHELEDTEYYPRKGVANPMGNNVFIFGACRSDVPKCGNPAQRHPGSCQVPKPDDDTFKLAVKACLDEDPMEGNCHKFAKQSEFGVMSMWDVSEVTDMSEAFADQDRFNGDLSQWDTRSVKYFDRMFSGAASFDQDISAWRYAAKKTDNHMFAGATAFKASWECGFRPSGLLDFHSCTSSKVMDDIVNGRGDATGASTSKKSSSSSLYNSISAAKTQPIAAAEKLSTSNNEASFGTEEAGVLTDANIMDEVTDCLLAEPVRGDCHGQAFGPLSTWDVSRVTNMDQLFMDPPKSVEGDRHSSFNGDLSKWDVSSVTSMIRMFNRANAFNGDLSRWDVSKVQSFSGMFKHTDRFNGDITNWNMKSAKSVDEMFMMALRFNQDVSKWSLPQCRNYDRMFEFTGENGFAHDISNWDMRASTHQDMFRDAFAFQQKFTCADAAHGPAHTCRPNASAATTPLTATRQPAVVATKQPVVAATKQPVVAAGKFVPQSEYDRVIDLGA
ncbi:unnamed protein product [Bathycoccus prasinos]